MSADDMAGVIIDITQWWRQGRTERGRRVGRRCNGEIGMSYQLSFALGPRLVLT